MCLLCEQFTGIHWAEQGANDWSTDHRIIPGKTPRLRERHLRVRIINQILARYGLLLSDWSGSSYMLSDQKGHVEIVQDLGTLWRTAHGLAGQPLDPLDPELLGPLHPDDGVS